MCVYLTFVIIFRFMNYIVLALTFSMWGEVSCTWFVLVKNIKMVVQYLVIIIMPNIVKIWHQSKRSCHVNWLWLFRRIEWSHFSMRNVMGWCQLDCSEITDTSTSLSLQDAFKELNFCWCSQSCSKISS